MMANVLIFYLEHCRMRLNQIIIAIHIVVVTGWAAVAGAIAVLATRGLGFSGMHLNIWLGFIFVGVVAGFINGWRRRLDLTGAARWLDEQQKNDEAFSAALISLERNFDKAVDETIVERADTLAGRAKNIQWPTRYLARKVGHAGGLLVIAILVIALWKPVPILDVHQLFIPKPGKNPVSNHFITMEDQFTQQSVQELARKLFPQNAKRVMEFQRAYEHGDVKKLDTLVKQAKLDYEEMISKSASTMEQQQATGLEQQNLERAQILLKKMRKREKNQVVKEVSQDSDGRESKKLLDWKETKQNDIKPDSNPRHDPSNDNSQKKNPFFMRYTLKNSNLESRLGNTKNGMLYKGGAQAGRENGNKKGHWTINADSELSKSFMKKGRRSSDLEYILPGKSAKVPLAKIIPDASRTAESALTRNGIPVEYHDSVKAYFLILSKEIQGNAPESEEQK